MGATCSCKPECILLRPKAVPEPLKPSSCWDQNRDVVDRLGSLSHPPSPVAEVVVTSLEDLEGGWFRKLDGKAVGELHEGQLIWNRRWGMDDASTDVFEISPGVLELQLRGMKYYGVISREAQASITWNDGDVWVRK
eukprot:Skav223959  [mRNA]  locus=scaffold3540:162369:166027:- [translate_table: standard]